MIRFIIKRKHKCQYSGAQQMTYETLDCQVPDLEGALLGGGYGENGYDIRDLEGAEVIPEEVDDDQ